VPELRTGWSAERSSAIEGVEGLEGVGGGGHGAGGPRQTEASLRSGDCRVEIAGARVEAWISRGYVVGECGDNWQSRLERFLTRCHAACSQLRIRGGVVGADHDCQ